MIERFLVDGVDAATPVAEAARRILLQKAAPMFDLERAAVGGKDTDAIHDMRVASRRTREALRLLAGAYRRKTFDAWNEVVGDVTGALGTMRDSDVFIATFHTLLRSADDPAERAAVAYLIGYRQAQRAADLKRMRKRVAALRLSSARKRFEKSMAATRDNPDTRRPLAGLAEEALAARAVTMFGFLPAALDAGNVEAQHAMRIACKKLRYAVETLAPCFDESFDRTHDTLVKFQDVLGEMHDLDVFAGAVLEVRGAGGAAAAGVTKQGLDAVVAALRERRRRAFQKFRTLCRAHPEAIFRSELLSAVRHPESGDASTPVGAIPIETLRAGWPPSTWAPTPCARSSSTSTTAATRSSTTRRSTRASARAWTKTVC